MAMVFTLQAILYMNWFPIRNLPSSMMLLNLFWQAKPSIKTDLFTPFNIGGIHAVARRGPKPGLFHQSMVVQTLSSRSISSMNNSGDSVAQDPSDSVSGVAPRIKFKRLDKTAHHIMQASIVLSFYRNRWNTSPDLIRIYFLGVTLQILDKEAVEEVKNQREIPDIKPGYIIQLKVVWKLLLYGTCFVFFSHLVDVLWGEYIDLWC